MAGYIGSKASVVSSGAERKKTFAISTTTTSLTGLSYTPTYVHVFHNGIRLVDGSDFTATNGTSITLSNSAVSGDEVVVISYSSFQVADHYNKTESDNRYINTAGDTLTGTLGGTAVNLSGDLAAVNTTLTGYLRGPSSFTIDPAAHNNDTGLVIIAGNLQVDGVSTTINSTTLNVEDLNLTLALGAADSASANGAGITINGASASLLYSHSGTKFVFNKPLDVTGTATSTTGFTTGANTRVQASSGMLFLNGPSALAFEVGAGSEKMRLTSTGLGIGTQSPGKLLTLSRTAEAQSEQLEFRTEAGGVSDGNYDGIVWTYGTNGSDVLAEQRINYYNTGVVDMSFNLRNEDNVLYLKAGGNVGIGTAGPTALLHVKKDVDSFIMKVENDGNSAGTSGASYADASDGLWVDTRWNTATNTPFKVTSNSGTAPMMIIKGNGNVGIGDDNPSDKLVVKGDGAGIGVESADMQVALLSKRSSSGVGLDQGYLRLRNQGSTANGAVIDSAGPSFFNGGNVGIGVGTAPSWNLQVAGRALVADTTARLPFYVSRAGGGAVTNSATIVSGAVAYFNGNIAGSDALRIGSMDNSTGAYYIDVSNYNATAAYDLVLQPYLGSVGIGTTTPDAYLHISGTNDNNLIIQNSTYQGSGQNTEAAIRFKVTASADAERAKAGIHFKNDGSAFGRGDLHFAVDSADDNGNVDINDSKMVITHEGNVGIGENSPGWALDVKGPNSGVQLQIGRSVGGSQGTAWLGADGTGFHIGTGTYSSGGFTVASPALKVVVSTGELIVAGPIRAKSNYMTIDGDFGTWQGRYQHLTCHNTITANQVWTDVAFVSYSPSLTIQGTAVRDNNGAMGMASYLGTIFGGYGSVNVVAERSTANSMNGGGFGQLEYRYLNGGASSGNYRLQVRQAITAGTMYITTTLTGQAFNQITED